MFEKMPSGDLLCRSSILSRPCFKRSSSLTCSCHKSEPLGFGHEVLQTNQINQQKGLCGEKKSLPPWPLMRERNPKAVLTVTVHPPRMSHSAQTRSLGLGQLLLDILQLLQEVLLEARCSVGILSCFKNILSSRPYQGFSSISSISSFIFTHQACHI